MLNKKVDLKLYVRKISGDLETPITIFKKFVGDEVGFLLESREGSKGRYSIMGRNPLAMIKAKGISITIQEKGKEENRTGVTLQCIKEYMEKFNIQNKDDFENLPFIGGAVGTVGYDINRQYERLPDLNKDDMNLPDVHQMIAGEMIVYDHLHQQIIILILEEEEQDDKKIEEKLDIIERDLMNPKYEASKENSLLIKKREIDKNPKANMTKADYMEIVEKAKKYIYEGDIFQVVLSQRWTLETEENPFDLYRKLRQINPSAYMFYLNFGDYQVAGSSPEMLVELRKDKIYTCPIAGTRKRGKDSKEDTVLAEELKNDPKERAEHVMLVDLGRNDMGRVSEIGSVKVLEFMEIKYYSHVMHLVSFIEGEKKKGEDMFSILATFIPAGTLSGAPKIRAMEIIEELENTRRGIYGGSVGYFGFNGDMDMCIAIRTMIVDNQKVYLQAGAGIVADSKAESEYEETKNKVEALISTLSKEAI